MYVALCPDPPRQGGGEGWRGQGRGVCSGGAGRGGDKELSSRSGLKDSAGALYPPSPPRLLLPTTTGTHPPEGDAVQARIPSNDHQPSALSLATLLARAPHPPAPTHLKVTL